MEPRNVYPSLTLLLFISMAPVLVVFLVSLDIAIVESSILCIRDKFRSIYQMACKFLPDFCSVQSTWGKRYKDFPLRSILNSNILVVSRAWWVWEEWHGAYTVIAFSPLQSNTRYLLVYWGVRTDWPIS
ncbi:hypothetical protein BDV09DRAFT_170975 [Aspergillus tetrazonus]